MLSYVKKRTIGSFRLQLGIVLVVLANTWAAGPDTKPALLWTNPTDISARNLFYGPGGKLDEPHGPFTFVKEDLNGTSPKYVVRDGAGVKWKVKLGLEARPETVATRLVWAVGYYATEDYFLGEIQIAGLPQHLHRGRKLIGPGGVIHNVRLKREPEGEKKLDIWHWDDSQFVHTREWNGLRTLMAVINNWDLKDQNNAIYGEDSQRIYLVSDLGASFGSAGRTYPYKRAKDNLDSYSHSKFIRRLGVNTVDFQTPARPMFVFLVNPKEYLMRVHLEHLGKDVPRPDAKWLGEMLADLSPSQIRDAFRAGGYSSDEVEAFSRLIQARIAMLTDL